MPYVPAWPEYNDVELAPPTPAQEKCIPGTSLTLAVYFINPRTNKKV